MIVGISNIINKIRLTRIQKAGFLVFGLGYQVRISVNRISMWRYFDRIRKNCLGLSNGEDTTLYKNVDSPLRLSPLERVSSNFSDLSTPSPSSCEATISPRTPSPSPRDIIIPDSGCEKPMK